MGGLDGDETADFSDDSEKFATIDSFGRSAVQRSKEMSRALDWLRNKDPNALEDIDDPFNKVPGDGKRAAKSEEEKKAEAMSKALGWLRVKGSQFSEEEPDFDFEKIGLAEGLPTKSAEERASDMASALDSSKQ